MKIINCQHCNHPFTPNVEWQTYCTPLCRMRAFHLRNQTSVSAAFSVDDVVPISINSFKDYEHSSCCYGWWRAESYLYIGATTNGFFRMTCHHVIGQLEPIYLGDEFHIWPTGTKNLANLERSLIKHFDPKHNRISAEPSLLVEPLPEPIRRSAAPICPYCNLPYIPFGRGKRRTYCRNCYIPEKTFVLPLKPLG